MRGFSLAAALVLLLAASVPANAAVIVLSSSADGYAYAPGSTYRQSGVQYDAINAYDSLPNLYVGRTINTNTWSGYNYVYESSLKFDLSTIPDNYVIQSATLKLYGPYDGLYGAQTMNLPFQVVYSANDNWVVYETYGAGSNGSSVPVRGVQGAVLDSQSILNPPTAGWTSWNLLANNAWDYSVDLTDNALSLVLKSSDESVTGRYTFLTANYTDPALRPQLIIEASAPIPEPASVVIWSLVGSVALSIPWLRSRLASKQTL